MDFGLNFMEKGNSKAHYGLGLNLMKKGGHNSQEFK
jgi:hypothetical protein